MNLGLVRKFKQKLYEKVMPVCEKAFIAGFRHHKEKPEATEEEARAYFFKEVEEGLGMEFKE